MYSISHRQKPVHIFINCVLYKLKVFWEWVNSAKNCWKKNSILCFDLFLRAVVNSFALGSQDWVDILQRRDINKKNSGIILLDGWATAWSWAQQIESTQSSGWTWGLCSQESGKLWRKGNYLFFNISCKTYNWPVISSMSVCLSVMNFQSGGLQNKLLLMCQMKLIWFSCIPNT